MLDPYHPWNTNTLNTTYTFHLQGNAEGSQGAPVIIKSPLAGNKLVSVSQSDSHLMVVYVPQNFYGVQYYSCRVRITIGKGIDKHYYQM